MKNLAEKLITILLIIFSGAALIYFAYPTIAKIQVGPTPKPSTEYPWSFFEGGPGVVDFGNEDRLLGDVVLHWRIYFNRMEMVEGNVPWTPEAIQPLGAIQAGKWIFFQIQGAPTWQQRDADIVTFAYYYCEKCRYWKPGFVWSANLNSFFVVMYDPETETGMVYDTSGNLVFDVTIEKE